ncbi:alpha/beta hydrolase [Enterococcus gilvus]|uniref:alpha/beta hydrolase n=1 Tax=Enterococcus gilvus TaxID=160453 RepID=UPI00345EAD05
MKKIIYGLFALMTAVLLSGCGTKQSHHEEENTSTGSTVTEASRNIVNKSDVPTLFIHGYGGTVNSFGGMLRRFRDEGVARKELTITVQPDGALQVDGQLNKKKDNPSIQVLFAANKDNEWNQTEWIYGVLKYLKEEGVDRVNLVGHSMGGVSSLRYLTTYGQPKDAPVIEKFVAIGAPFNDFDDTAKDQSIDDVLQNGPTPQSSRYLDYRNGINNVPSSVSVLLLAGKLNEQDPSDGTVPLSSALATYSLLKAHGNPIKEQIFTGSNAQHSQLHENPAVDQVVATFLWG